MRALLDVCALIALLDKNHVHHVKVAGWFAEQAPVHGWASCPLTQNGAARIIGLAAYPNKRPPRQTLDLIAGMTARPAHAFWQDNVSLADTACFDPAVVLLPHQLTDVYLLGLAVRHGGRLVSTDRNILTTAVKGFQARHLEVL